MQRTILSNGATIATQRVAGAATAMVALQLMGGARAQQPQEAGFAHLAEHVLMTPSAPTSHGAADQAELFAQLGGEINGYSGREHIALVGHVRPDAAARLAAHFVDRITGVRFDDAVVREEVARLVQESSLAQGAAGDMEAVLFNCLWPDHPLNNARFPTDTPTGAARSAALRAFWQRTCTGPAATLLAVGAVDHDAIAAAAAHVGLLSAAPPASLGAPWRLGESGVRVIRPVDAAAEGRLIWIVPADEASAGADFLLHLLCGTQRGELYRLLRERGLHMYGLDAVHLRYRDAAMVAFAVGTTSRTHEEIRSLVERHLASMVEHGFDTARLESHRASWTTRQFLDAARLDYHLERLARRIDDGSDADAGAVSASDFLSWLSRAWAARVILDCPPGDWDTHRDPRPQAHR